MAKLAKQSPKEMEEKLKVLREDLRKFRFGSSGSRTTNVKAGRNLRKEVARLLTALNQSAK